MPYRSGSVSKSAICPTKANSGSSVQPPHSPSRLSLRNSREYVALHPTGLIAQEVREVLPDSVSKTTAFVPNIYKAATALTSNTVTLDGHGLVPGDKVRLVSEINANIETKVIFVDGSIFTVEADLTKETRLFVFGKEVEDFLILDYDHVINVAVGAIQELSTENTALKSRLDSLESRLAAAGI